MTSTRFLSGPEAVALVDDLLAEHVRVVAPAHVGAPGHERLDMTSVGSGAAVCFAAPITTRSMKECFLPPTEVLVRWWQQGGEVTLGAREAQAAMPTVVIGARPCDAAAVEKLDRVMGWGQPDDLWFARREATTIIALACSTVDDACFCTAVGLGPDSRRGVDLLWTQVPGGFHVDVVTPKGESLVSAHAQRFSTADGAATLTASGQAAQVHETSRRRVAEHLQIDPLRVRAWIESHFSDGLWQQLATRCHGCGVCAAVCPSCHCFDIVDEPLSHLHGERRRNWDTCQAARFTLHSSGHNPRGDQNARYRQRLAHKFSIYPQRFGEILCTGCGRCVRACPAGMDLREILLAIDTAARDAAAARAGADSEAKAGSESGAGSGAGSGSASGVNA